MNQACACECTHIHTSTNISNRDVTWADVLSFQPPTNSFHCILHRTETLIVELCNTVYGCNQHGVVTARFPLGWPDSVIPLSKTFTLLGGHSYLQPLWKFLKQKMSGGMRIALPHYQLVSFTPHQQLESTLVTTALISWALKRTVATKNNTEDEVGLNITSVQTLAATFLLWLYFSNPNNRYSFILTHSLPAI